MNKKIVSILLVSLLSVSTAACGTDKEATKITIEADGVVYDKEPIPSTEGLTLDELASTMTMAGDKTKDDLLDSPTGARSGSIISFQERNGYIRPDILGDIDVVCEDGETQTDVSSDIIIGEYDENNKLIADENGYCGKGVTMFVTCRSDSVYYLVSLANLGSDETYNFVTDTLPTAREMSDYIKENLMDYFPEAYDYYLPY